MSTIEMPRERSNYRIDTRIIEGMKILSERRGLSINATVEDLLWAHLQALAIIPSDAERLKEQRGNPKGTKPPGRWKPTTPIGVTEEPTPSEGETIM